MIKVLTPDDWDSLATAIKALPYHRVAQTRQNVSEEEFLKYTYAIFRAPNSTVYGYYNDANELSSMISVVGFSQMPAYAVYNWRNLKPTNIYDPVKNGWAALWNRLIEDQEAKKLYTFYMLRTTEISRLQYKKYHNIYMTHVPKFLDYERTVEEVVPAGQFTNWGFFNTILYHGKPLDYETMVLKFTCKQKFRNNVNQDLQTSLTIEFDET